MYKPVRVWQWYGGWRFGVQLLVGRKYVQVLYLTTTGAPRIARIPLDQAPVYIKDVPEAAPDYLPKYADMIRSFMEYGEGEFKEVNKHLTKMEKSAVLT